MRADLNRVLGWSGRDVPVPGRGVRIAVDGPLPGDALEQLLNELRNAGAEAIAIGDTRIVPGDVPNGPAGDGARRGHAARRTRSSSWPSASRRPWRAR